MTEILTYVNSAILALLLIAGGWVKIRDWFKTKAAAKAEAAEAAAKAKADEIEALVQERLKKLKAETSSSPVSTGTSTTGAVVATETTA